MFLRKDTPSLHNEVRTKVGKNASNFSPSIQGDNSMITNVENQTVVNQSSLNSLEQNQSLNSSFIKKTPVEIFDDVGSVPPYQEKEKASSYLDLYVEWNGLSLLTILQTPNNNHVSVILELPEGSHLGSVSFKTSVDDYPFLKILEKGELLDIKGKIVHVSKYNVDLEITSLTRVE